MQDFKGFGDKPKQYYDDIADMLAAIVKDLNESSKALEEEKSPEEFVKGVSNNEAIYELFTQAVAKIRDQGILVIYTLIDGGVVRTVSELQINESNRKFPWYD